MAFNSTHMLFKSLNNVEETTFRQYARDNDCPSTDFAQWLIYHPVCRDEWRALDKAPVNAPYTTEEAQAAHIRLTDFDTVDYLQRIIS